jgi:cysteine desulfurase
MNPIYFDNAATTKVDSAVMEAMLPYLTDLYGNPSSIHTIGQLARRAIEQTRNSIAKNIGAYPDELVFTSGGTESNNHAIQGVAFALRDRGNRIITSSVEHQSVLKTCHYLERRGFEIVYLSVDGNGLVDPDDVQRAINERTILVSIMHANNEIGTIEPIEDIARITSKHGVLFHTDAVQSFGHVPIELHDPGIDLLSASAHKIHGPKGVGLLYIRRGTRIHPFIHGGKQEDGRRASTHNVPGIVGFGKSVIIAIEHMERNRRKTTDLRDKLIQGIIKHIREVQLNGHPSKRLPNNVHVSFRGVDGESLLLSLDMSGVACSTGSACSFATHEQSHVLRAIGLDEGMAIGSMRFSLGRFNSEDDIDRVLEILPSIVDRLRSVSSFHSNNQR